MSGRAGCALSYLMNFKVRRDLTVISKPFSSTSLARVGLGIAQAPLGGRALPGRRDGPRLPSRNRPFPFSGLGRCLRGVSEFYLMVVFSVLNLARPCLENLVNEPLKRSGNAPFPLKVASATPSRVRS